MVYLLFAVCSYLYLLLLSKYKEVGYKTVIVFSLPVIFAWVLIIGSQYYVGTDYPTYLSLFKNIDSAKNEDTEFGFVYFVYLCNYLGFYGQDLFFIIAFFWILSLLQISRTITTSKYVFIFVFVFVTVSTVFNNQMNGVRQYVAVYFFTSSVLYMLNKKYVLFLIAFFLSFSWHMSAVILVPILLLFYFFKLQNSRFLLSSIVLFSIAFNFFFKEEWLYSFIAITNLYDSYLDSDYVQEVSLFNKLTKLMYTPVVLCSIYKFKKYDLNFDEKSIFVIGVYSYVIFMACLSNTLTNRFGMYFTILSCIPFVYFLIYLYKKKTLASYLLYLLLCFFILLVYALKVTRFSTGEYAFDSIFFH